MANPIEVIGQLVTACVPMQKSQAGRAMRWEPRVPVPAVKELIPEILRLAGKPLQFGPLTAISLGSDEAGISLRGSGLGGLIDWKWPHNEFTRKLLSGEWSGVPMHSGWEVSVRKVKNHLPEVEAGKKPGEVFVRLAAPIQFRYSFGWLVRKITTVSVHGFEVGPTEGRPAMTGLPTWLMQPVLVWQDYPAEPQGVATKAPRRSQEDRAREMLEEYFRECREKQVSPTVAGAHERLKRGLGLLVYLRMFTLLAELVLLVFGKRQQKDA